MNKCEKEKEGLLWVFYAMKNGSENLDYYSDEIDFVTLPKR